MKKPVQLSVSAKSSISKSKHKIPKADEIMESVLYTERFPEGVEPAFVRFSEGLTRSLGNYEFLRIDVAVTLPCLPEKINETYVKAKEFVETSLSEEMRELDK